MLKSLSRPVRCGIIAGVILLTGLIVSGVANYGVFLNLGGLAIVAGGCIASSYLSYPREEVEKALHTIRDTVKNAPAVYNHLHRDIRQFILWAYVVQQQDMVGLDRESAEKVHDPLMRYGLDMVISGYSANAIRRMMGTAAKGEFERRCAPVGILRSMANNAFTFGMAGTLVGMAIVLKHAGGDVTAIASGVGVAMLSTFYGILAARLVCLPAADRLMQKEEMRHVRHTMVTEGLALLAQRHKPYYIQDRLNSFLEPSRHIDLGLYLRGNLPQLVPAMA